MPQIPLLTQSFLTETVRAFPDMPFIGDSILPLQSIDSWTSMWDVLGRDTAIAPFVSINGESALAADQGATRVFAEVADIRQKFAIAEDDLLNLRLPGEPDTVLSGLGRTRVEVAEQKFRDELRRMTQRVLGRVEWMRWQALSVGTIAVATGDVQFSVNYGVPALNIATLQLGARWSQIATANPLTDINAMITQVRSVSGRRPRKAYVGSSVPGWLVNNAAIRTLFANQQGLPQLLNEETVLTYLGTVLGLDIKLYDTTYVTDAGVATPFLPAACMVILPDATDGEKLGDVATAPAAANDYQTGLYSWMTEEKDPWRTFVGAGIHAFPRIFHPTWIGIINTNG